LGRGVAEIQERIDAREFAEWMAYYRLEPWGEERADMRMAVEASSIVNCWIDAKHRTKPKDFLYLRDEQDQEQQNIEAMKAQFKIAVSANG
jgi:hypothetical protein